MSGQCRQYWEATWSMSLFACWNHAGLLMWDSKDSLGGQDEISRTVQELEKVGIIRPAHSPYSSPIWPVWKLDGTWRMTVDYRELNKVTLPIHAAIPNIAFLMDILSREIKTYHCVLELGKCVLQYSNCWRIARSVCIYIGRWAVDLSGSATGVRTFANILP